MPSYFLNDFNQATRLLSEIDQPHVQLQFDVYHRQIQHGDVIMALRAMMPAIGHIQTASVPDRQEPMSGELNDALIFGEIDRLGYRGYVGCEYRPAGRTADGPAWLSATKA
jgi:hydroxypyruvate isomerase